MKSLFRILVAVAVAVPAFAIMGDDLDLDTFSLEELLDVEVVTVSKRAERVQDAAAAVFVITAEDIRRSGATTIPEALRLAPGLHVARIDAYRWAISARGFSERFANKLQVLVDGRSIYSPMFSGTYWESSEVPVEDIERIEVIRGPGATLWGANAVNGVINVITRKASSDDGGRLSVAAGPETKYRVLGRLSGSATEGESYRLSALVGDYDGTLRNDGSDARDDWSEFLLNGRWSADLSDRDHVTATGHYFESEQGATSAGFFPSPPYSSIRHEVIDFHVGSAHLTWDREISERSGFSLDLAKTWFHRSEYLLQDVHGILDVEAKHDFALGSRHQVIWGLGYRRYDDDQQGIGGYGFDPATISEWTVSGFVQDEIAIVPEKLRLTLGVKYEDRDFIDPEWQPNMRFAWTPNEDNTLWGSVSKAVRVPSRANRDIFVDIGIMPPGATPGNPDFPVMITMLGNDAFASEHLHAFELGYRVRPMDAVHLDLAAFVNDYEGMMTLTPSGMRPHPIYGMPVMQMMMLTDNGPFKRTKGGEADLNVRLSEGMRLQGSYSVISIEQDDPTGDLNDELGAPETMATLRVMASPADGVELDLFYRYRDAFSIRGSSYDALDELDVRLGWSPTPDWTFAVTGTSLLDERHIEFADHSGSAYGSEIERAFLLTCERRFW